MEASALDSYGCESSPAILDAFRNEEIGIREAMAFTLFDDHAELDRVLAELTLSEVELTRVFES